MEFNDLRELLEGGAVGWNTWRRDNSEVEIDLSEAYLDKVNLEEADLYGINFNNADLIHANLRGANLIGSDLTGGVLRHADLSNTFLTRAKLFSTDLRRANLCNSSLASLLPNELSGASFVDADLSFADLRSANFTNADLRGASLREANLYGTNLTRIQAQGTDFTGANFTGACVENWSIDSTTKLDNAICEHVYIKSDYIYSGILVSEIRFKERRPISRGFQSGEFTQLFQKVTETIDLIFVEEFDWKAFSMALCELRSEYQDAGIAVQGIERKSGGSFIVRLEVAPQVDKGAIEKAIERKYKTQLKHLETLYRESLMAKDREIKIYRRQSAEMSEIVKLLASNPPVVENMNQIRNINTAGGNYVESNSGTYVEGNYINMSQDLAQAAVCIQELLAQLGDQNVPIDVAQEQVAEDIANQARNNPTMKNKLVKWGQSIGETTVSDVVKGVVKLAIRSAGIPIQ